MNIIKANEWIPSSIKTQCSNLLFMAEQLKDKLSTSDDPVDVQATPLTCSIIDSLHSAIDNANVMLDLIKEIPEEETEAKTVHFNVGSGKKKPIDETAEISYE